MPDRESLRDVLTELAAGDPAPLPACEDWQATIERIHVTGRVHAITEEIFDYFLDVLPPKLHGGPWFAFAEGQQPLTIFWRNRGTHYCRRLTEEETGHICTASGLSRNYGC